MPFIPHTENEIHEMLETVGARNLPDLFSSIPSHLRMKEKLQLPEPMAEIDLRTHLDELASKNLAGRDVLSFLGGGIYSHYVPAAVNDLAFRGEFLTPYTPYQPEISQGTLQVMFEFQSMMCRIFGMDISNASTYDLSTSVAEAALMSLRIQPKRKKILISGCMHPEYREVLATALKNVDANLVTIPHKNGSLDHEAFKKELDANTAAVLVQYPNFFGVIEPLRDLSKEIHAAGGLFITATAEPIALGLLASPGELDADIAIAEGNSFGLPTRFGGPALGVFTAKEKFVRNMPGRIAGETTDSQGRKGYVLTLSTREQHIRREKATSNICSNHQHCATIATIYLALLGKQGFKELAEINAAKAQYAFQKLTAIKGVSATFGADYFFNEFVLTLNKPVHEVLAKLRAENIHAGSPLEAWYPELKNSLLLCFTEVHKKTDIDRLAEVLQKTLNS